MRKMRHLSLKIELITAPVIEPVTLAELKLHSKVDSGSFADNIDTSQSLAPDSYAIAADYTTHVGTGVDVLGYTALVNLNSGTNVATGTVDCKIQESDDDITYTDWTGGAFVQVTTANDNAIQEIAYTGTKQYIRTVAKVLLAICDFGTTVIRLTATMVEDDLLDGDIEASRERVEDETRRALLTQTWDMHLDEFPAENFIDLPFGNLQSVTHVKYTESDGTVTNLTKTITAFADSTVDSGTKTKVTSAAHGYSDGDMVHISGTTSYDGGFEISNVTTNTFDIVVVFVADDATGTASTYYIVETNGDQFGRIVLPYSEPWPSFTAYPSNPIVIRFICGWITRALVPSKIKQAILMYCDDLYQNRESQTLGIINQAYSENVTAANLLNSMRLWM